MLDLSCHIMKMADSYMCPKATIINISLAGRHHAWHGWLYRQAIFIVCLNRHIVSVLSLGLENWPCIARHSLARSFKEAWPKSEQIILKTPETDCLDTSFTSHPKERSRRDLEETQGEKRHKERSKRDQEETQEVQNSEVWIKMALSRPTLYTKLVDKDGNITDVHRLKTDITVSNIFWIVYYMHRAALGGVLRHFPAIWWIFS